MVGFSENFDVSDIRECVFSPSPLFLVGEEVDRMYDVVSGTECGLVMSVALAIRVVGAITDLTLMRELGRAQFRDSRGDGVAKAIDWNVVLGAPGR